jgi:hypothetical protein
MEKFVQFKTIQADVLLLAIIHLIYRLKLHANNSTVRRHFKMPLAYHLRTRLDASQIHCSDPQKCRGAEQKMREDIVLLSERVRMDGDGNYINIPNSLFFQKYIKVKRSKLQQQATASKKSKAFPGKED